MKTHCIENIPGEGQTLIRLVSSAEAERFVCQPVDEIVTENGEKLLAVSWISKTRPDEPVFDLYHVDRLEKEVGDWIENLRPGCRKVTVRTLKSLEGEEFDAETYHMPWGRMWVESIYPKGTLLPT
jgi:hypothetical protein